MMLNRISSVTVNAAWPAANEIAAGATPATRIAGGSRTQSTVVFGADQREQHGRRSTNPTTVPSSAARRRSGPVLSAFERSTDSVPSTTQNECCTPVRFGDEDRQPQPDRAAHAVVQPHRVPLDVRRRALLRGRSVPADALGLAAEQPVQPAAPLGGARSARCSPRSARRRSPAPARGSSGRASDELADLAVVRARRGPGGGQLRGRGCVPLASSARAQLGQRPRAGVEARAAASSSRSAPRSSTAAAAAFTAQVARSSARSGGSTAACDDGVQPVQLVDEPHHRACRRCSGRSAGTASRGTPRCSAATAASACAIACVERGRGRRIAIAERVRDLGAQPCGQGPRGRHDRRSQRIARSAPATAPRSPPPRPPMPCPSPPAGPGSTRRARAATRAG